MKISQYQVILQYFKIILQLERLGGFTIHLQYICLHKFKL